MSENADELKHLLWWLTNRAGDADDAVVDELQEEEFARLEAEDERDGAVTGTDEYRVNTTEVAEAVARLKDGRRQDGRLPAVGAADGTRATHDGRHKCFYKGPLDGEGRPHGDGLLVYEDKSVFRGCFEHGAWNRVGLMATERGKTEGTWTDGLLHGEAKIIDNYLGGWVEGYFRSGVAHGFQREFGPKDVGSRAVGITDGRLVRFVGRCFRGVRRGFCWKGLFGGGFLCGYVDKEGEFSGDDIAFIYPDFKTVIRGRFEKEQLVEGKVCQLLGCKFSGGMPVPRFTAATSEVVFTFDAPSKLSVGLNPTLPDPFEADAVEVKESTLPQGGEGLFAKRDIKKGDLVSLFNGVRLRTSTWASLTAPHSDYRIRLNADIDLDIPDDCTALKAYCATLAHKANHSYVPNSDWAFVEHPRFGLIRGLRAKTDIAAGQEVLVNYHMNLGDAPLWYRQVWLGHQRRHKGMSDEAVARLLARYTENTTKRVELDLGDDGDAAFVVPPPRGVEGMAQWPDDAEGEVSGEEVQAMREKVANMINGK